MTTTETLSAQDLEQLAGLGITTAEIERQLELFRHPPPAARLVGNCRPSHGIVQIQDEEVPRLEERWRSLARRRRLIKFVPASGAATRMFKNLSGPPSDQASRQAGTRFLESLPRFAFTPALEESLAAQGLQLEQLVAANDLSAVLDHLLDPTGLDYRRMPKGLVLFHSYPGGERSALEEHFWEGVDYLDRDNGKCRFHFTVAMDFLPAFHRAFEDLRSKIENELQLALEAEFSCQRPATDTLAVAPDNRPFRTADGGLLLRPSGHGALLENLQGLDADVAFIKNIDNVAHRRLHPGVVRWKRVLAGYFHRLQEEIFALLDRIQSTPDDQEVHDQVLRWVGENLTVSVPPRLASAGVEERHGYLVDRLDRPLRVCGMVKNVGEPGGGPFWLAGREGELSGQIVERAQVDFDSPDQAELWAGSTHFNPTDLVCGLRDRHGQPYDLSQFVDPSATFITLKSFEGRPLKALERPGLWNGAMAGWNTVFVEVPLETFNPVKTVFDLLRPGHQP